MMSTASENKQSVILLHGFGGGRWMMGSVATRLQQSGFRPSFYNYRSFANPFEREVDRLVEWFANFGRDHSEPIDLVAHSMGNLLLRAAWPRLQEVTFRRWVMLCPPNHGSFVATRIASAIGPAFPMIKILKDDQQSLVHHLPVPNRVEFGIIASSGDLVVRTESTKLEGASDFLLVSGMHSRVPFQENVLSAIQRFLEYGRFAK